MRAIAAGVTDVGKERDHNEDRFVLLPEFEVFAVADGMGGHQCGEVASRMATTTIAQYFREHRQQRSNGSISEVLTASLVEANQRIHRRATNSHVHRGMGTTVVAAAFNRFDEKLHIAHAGDSRCYRLRSGAFELLTRDHSLVEEALRTRPDITESELAYLPGNVITRALGVEPTVEIDVSVHKVMPGDLFLLCSDGLHGFVADDRIRDVISGTPVLTKACAQLVAEANANGGGDNITAVLVRIETQDEPWALATSLPPAPRRRSSPAPHNDDPDRTSEIGPGDDAAHEITATASGHSDAARARLEAEDTAQVAAVTDPEAVLAGLEDTEGDDED
jgi:protein phosphatase